MSAKQSDDGIAYINGNGRLLAKVEGNDPATEEVHYGHQDHLGSTLLMIDDEYQGLQMLKLYVLGKSIEVRRSDRPF